MLYLNTVLVLRTDIYNNSLYSKLHSETPLNIGLVRPLPLCSVHFLLIGIAYLFGIEYFVIYLVEFHAVPKKILKISGDGDP